MAIRGPALKIALVWPRGQEWQQSIPLPFAYLISNLDNPCHEIRIFDGELTGCGADSDEFCRFLSEYQPAIVGVSCWLRSFQEGLAVLKKTKDLCPNAVTIIGGPFATAYPHRIMENQYVDFLFRGEAELAFRLFVDELSKDHPDYSNIGGLVYRSAGQLVLNEMYREEDMDRIKLPDYDAIGLSIYFDKGYRLHTNVKRNAPIWLTRGCPYECAFCTGPILNGKRIRYHSVEYAVRWIKYLYFEKGVRFINILDDNFTFNIDYAKSICAAIIGLNLKDLQMHTPNGVRMQKLDGELLGLMKRAGWRQINIAPESGSRRVLRLMRKGINPDIVPEKTALIHAAGLLVHAYILLGFPGETREDIDETIKLVKKNPFDTVAVSIFQPLPGTPIYDQLLQSGKITDQLLPNNIATGDVTYVSEGLRSVNLHRIAVYLHLLCALRSPLSLVRFLKRFSPSLLLKRLLELFYRAARVSHTP